MCLCVSVCVCVCVYSCACVCACVCVYTCWYSGCVGYSLRKLNGSVCVHMCCVCVCVYVHLWLAASKIEYMCVYTYVCVCMCMYVCMYVCAYACLCVQICWCKGCIVHLCRKLNKKVFKFCLMLFTFTLYKGKTHPPLQVVSRLGCLALAGNQSRRKTSLHSNTANIPWVSMAKYTPLFPKSYRSWRSPAVC